MSNKKKKNGSNQPPNATSLFTSSEDLRAYYDEQNRTCNGVIEDPFRYFSAKEASQECDSTCCSLPEVTPEASSKYDESKPKTPSRKLSMHELSLRVLDNERILNITNALYCYERPLYKLIKFIGFTEILRNHLSKKELDRLNIYDFKGSFEFLFTDSSIKIAEAPIYPNCVMFENGYFNISTHQELVISPDKLVFNMLHADYEATKITETPAYDAFLNSCSGGDDEIKSLINAFIGYCLIPNPDGKYFFVLGTEANSGKSVLAKFLQRLVGEDMTSSVSLNDFHNTFALAPLVGKVLNLSMDLEAGSLNSKAVSAIKMMTGGDTITINEKYQPMFSYNNKAKFIFATNSPVTLKKPDNAFWERMVLIPFLQAVPKSQQDMALLDKLWDERNGIVAIAMKAAKKLIKKNYVFPPCRVAETMKASWTKDATHSVNAFVENCCNLSDLTTRAFTHHLYQAYINYCVENAFVIESANFFSRILGSKFGLVRGRWSEDGCTPQRGFQGITLR